MGIINFLEFFCCCCSSLIQEFWVLGDKSVLVESCDRLQNDDCELLVSVSVKYTEIFCQEFCTTCFL